MAGSPDRPASGLSQDNAPIYDAVREYQSRQITALHTPGHKGKWFAGGLSEIVTPVGLACDVPCMDATDHMMHPSSCIKDAQALAAELFGAGSTKYLTNGATEGVHAMMLAAVAPEQEILLSRHFHLSAFGGLALSGAVPRYLPAAWTENAGPLPPTDSEVEAALSRYPSVRAVFLTQPTYYGLGRPLASIAAVCRRKGIPLLVDEAHGAHLQFLPVGHLRPSLDQGADLVVQSPHKTLGSLVGTAQLHLSSDSRISEGALRTALNLIRSTSPNYLLLMSLDLVRRDLSRSASRSFTDAVDRAESLKGALRDIPGVKVLVPATEALLGGCEQDPLRLLIDVSKLGMSGNEVEGRLMDSFGILCEFSDARNVAFVLTPWDEPDAYSRLANGLRDIAARAKPNYSASGDVQLMSLPEMALTPRQAVFAATVRVPLKEAVGSVSGEIITQYPPGIPLICPGERFSYAVVHSLEEAKRRRISVLCEDSTLKTVTTIRG